MNEKRSRTRQDSRRAWATETVVGWVRVQGSRDVCLID